jgi:uncharacterized membrane protein
VSAPTATPPLEPRDLAPEERPRLDGWVVAIADPILTGISRHWLAVVNLLVALGIVGALAAPLLQASGATSLASAVYGFYHGLCHQWAFRSFFLFGPSVVYGREQLDTLGVDPFAFVGTPDLGWKMGFCERDLAIFAGLLLFGLLYAGRWRRAGLRPSGYVLYALLAVPMALDGFTQLFGWRESTWELRVLTGLLFGVASAWLLFPRFEVSFDKGIGA